MKKRALVVCLCSLFVIEVIALVVFATQKTESPQDAVAVNEVAESVRMDWHAMEKHKNRTGLDYVVLDADGTVQYRTKTGLSESTNEAVMHRDTILDVEVNHEVVGKIIVYNDSTQNLQSQKQKIIVGLLIVLFLQFGICVAYIIYLDRTVIAPFDKLKGFAKRIAGGNLDIPLEMDRQNLFGAFTESFDIMRSELKKARKAEAEANAGKKELVAKLSHDIKTPVASIKAVSEVGVALAEDEKSKDHYTQIIQKADQINSLVTNLFTATLEELNHLPITPIDLESGELKSMLEGADYLNRAAVPEIPDCLIYADKLRLQQVFDNIFANSYKYAQTDIEVSVQRTGDGLAVVLEDFGGGVDEAELPLLKEKFKRGSNAGNLEGAGLGLYISDYFMQKMKGELLIQNGQNGLRVTVMISFSGTI